jgi:hypothetical protein
MQAVLSQYPLEPLDFGSRGRPGANPGRFAQRCLCRLDFYGNARGLGRATLMLVLLI